MFIILYKRTEQIIQIQKLYHACIETLIIDHDLPKGKATMKEA